VLAQPIRDAVADLGAVVEHVGSTAVAGLAAKPVIDFDVVVRVSADIPTVIDRLARLGYKHQGDLGVRGREALKWPDRSKRHHLYVVVAGTQAHRDHVDFRNYLRANRQEAEAYADLKRRLAQLHADDRIAYSTAKGRFVTQALRRARA
jgi:GrpB-like predicted nucleotidyltransferase (UPF0157 family)